MLIEAGWKPALPGSVESFVITKFRNAHGSERSYFDATFSSRRHVLVSKPRSCFDATFLFRRHVLVSAPRSRFGATFSFKAMFSFRRQHIGTTNRPRLGAEYRQPGLTIFGGGLRLRRCRRIFLDGGLRSLFSCLRLRDRLA